jgi:hypothetical protein
VDQTPFDKSIATIPSQVKRVVRQPGRLRFALSRLLFLSILPIFLLSLAHLKDIGLRFTFFIFLRFLIWFLGLNDILSPINLPEPLNQGELAMGDRGSKDKGKKEERKKAKLNPKEKRKLKNEKKNPTTYNGIPR